MPANRMPILRRKPAHSPGLIRPVHLARSDTVGLVAPASPPPDPKAIDAAAHALERLGFKPQLAPNIRQRHGFLAGTDRQRADDLMRMFTDPRVKAIFCLRGGYGTARLLHRLDYRAIRRHPKILVGYSDITSLHCALLTKAGLVSFHGPMGCSDLAHPELPDFTLQGLLRTLTQPSAPGSIRTNYRGRTVSVLKRGTASGPLLGGNLSLLCTTLGTPWQPSFQGRILFFEDLDEPPYRIDRLLTQLLNAGLLQQAAGIAVGLHKNCVDPRARRTREYRQTLDDVLRERLLPLGVPVVAGLPFGHVPHNATLPLGIQATLDATNGDLLITQPAVL